MSLGSAPNCVWVHVADGPLKGACLPMERYPRPGDWFEHDKDGIKAIYFMCPMADAFRLRYIEEAAA